eukprot:5972655-Amphidinium_carterae.1
MLIACGNSAAPNGGCIEPFISGSFDNPEFSTDLSVGCLRLSTRQNCRGSELSSSGEVSVKDTGMTQEYQKTQGYLHGSQVLPPLRHSLPRSLLLPEWARHPQKRAINHFNVTCQLSSRPLSPPTSILARMCIGPSACSPR